MLLSQVLTASPGQRVLQISWVETILFLKERGIIPRGEGHQTKTDGEPIEKRCEHVEGAWGH